MSTAERAEVEIEKPRDLDTRIATDDATYVAAGMTLRQLESHCARSAAALIDPVRCSASTNRKSSRLIIQFS